MQVLLLLQPFCVPRFTSLVSYCSCRLELATGWGAECSEVVKRKSGLGKEGAHVHLSGRGVGFGCLLPESGVNTGAITEWQQEDKYMHCNVPAASPPSLHTLHLEMSWGSSAAQALLFKCGREFISEGLLTPQNTSAFLRNKPVAQLPGEWAETFH